ncbi:MAG: RAD55 family ATPase, partial [Bdellovibrionia bacterium]
MSQKDQIQIFKRVPTHIPGLDEMLCGGFLRGGIYLVMGTPGAGKTILATQFGFKHCERGGRALYVSLLSEGHGRLFGHLKPLSFFDEAPISESFNFISAYQTLEKEGLDGLLRSLAHMVRQYRADLLFLDGVASAEDLAKSPVSFKKFVHELSTVLSTSGCTAVLLSSFTDSLAHPEHTMVDGIISLSAHHDSMRSVREIEIMKLRGSDHFRGRHIFTVTDEGI